MIPPKLIGGSRGVWNWSRPTRECDQSLHGACTNSIVLNHTGSYGLRNTVLTSFFVWWPCGPLIDWSKLLNTGIPISQFLFFWFLNHSFTALINDIIRNYWWLVSSFSVWVYKVEWGWHVWLSRRMSNITFYIVMIVPPFNISLIASLVVIQADEKACHV